MTAALLAITIYIAPTGAPLFCDRGQGLVYDPDASWIAWDFATYGGRCGDMIEVVHQGVSRRFRALDSGRFGAFCVRTPEGCLPIMADLPQHLAWFGGLSVPVQSARNVSAERRARNDYTAGLQGKIRLPMGNATKTLELPLAPRDRIPAIRHPDLSPFRGFMSNLSAEGMGIHP